MKGTVHGPLLDRDPAGFQKVSAPAVGPSLCCRFIHGCADVGQCVNLGGEKTYVREESCKLQVVDCRVPLGVGV